MIHQHSVQAHAEEQALGNLSRRAREIVTWVKAHGPATDREVKDGLGFADMNSVRPRITEAVDTGELVEVAERRCPVTGKTVRVVSVSLVLA